jgi:hypothetical protein
MILPGRHRGLVCRCLRRGDADEIAILASCAEGEASMREVSRSPTVAVFATRKMAMNAEDLCPLIVGIPTGCAISAVQAPFAEYNS